LCQKGKKSGVTYDVASKNPQQNLRDELSRITELTQHLLVVASDDNVLQQKREESLTTLHNIASALNEYQSTLSTDGKEKNKHAIEEINQIVTSIWKIPSEFSLKMKRTHLQDESEEFTEPPSIQKNTSSDDSSSPSDIIPSAQIEEMLPNIVTEIDTPHSQYIQGEIVGDFPEDKYLSLLQLANDGKLTADDCARYSRVAAEEMDITSALMLCEKAVEKYREEENTQRVCELRAFSASLISKIEAHPLRQFSTTIAPRDQSLLGTFIPHLDTGSVKFGVVHAEKRVVHPAQGSNREIFHFDFQISVSERTRLEKSTSSIPTEMAKRLEKLELEIKEQSSTIEQLEADDKFEETEPLYNKIRDLEKEKLVLKKEASIQSLAGELQRSVSYLPQEYRAVTCRYENTIYPIFQDGAYHEAEGYNLSSGSTAHDLVIEFQGIGRIKLGGDRSCVSGYTSVSVELDNVSDPHNLERMHTMLSLLGLNTVVAKSHSSDVARTKVFHLFRSYFPKTSFEMENNLTFFEMPVKTLVQKIIEKQPEMQEIFAKYFIHHSELLAEEEIYPGFPMVKIEDFGEQVRQHGGVGLATHITGGNFDQQAENVCRICTYGFISSKDRYQRGLITPGSSIPEDFKSGGADCVFTRLITRGMIGQGASKIQLMAQPTGSIQLFFSTDAMGLCGTYGYGSDRWGTRSHQDATYFTRKNLLELTQSLSADEDCQNEVMIRGRLSPRYIRSVVVQSDEDKARLIERFRANHLVSKQGEQEYVLGKPIDQFICVAENFSERLWN